MESEEERCREKGKCVKQRGEEKRESWADSQLSPEREVRAADTSLESVCVCSHTVECGLCERRWQQREQEGEQNSGEQWSAESNCGRFV